MRTGNAGAARLGKVLRSYVRDNAPKADTTLLLGTIQTDMSLLLDAYTTSWPVTGYLCLEQFTDVVTLPHVGVTDSQGTPAHTHNVTRDGAFTALKPGDRVLVALIQERITPIVLGRVRFPPLAIPV